MDLDARTTAFVIIDLQKGVLGMATQPRPALEILDATTRLAGRLRTAGGLIVWVRVQWSPDFGDLLRQTVAAPSPYSPEHLPADFATFPEEVVEPKDLVVTKRQWGAFYGTDLDLQLRRRGIRTVVLGGIATNYGVESTARDAWEHGYSLVIAEDLTASLSTEMHDFSMRFILPRLGLISSSSELSFQGD